MLKLRPYVLSLLLLLKILPAEAQTSSSEIYLQIKKLNVLSSVLYVAAHPDDENTRLITYLSKDRLYRAGYLSITRGDGGQNLIGDEQGVELGLIRTQELLSARGIDGGEQFFTRAYDFGFSKTTEETFKKWDKNKILADVVRVIRKFHPDVIITRFPEDSRAGHGHHSASAVLAHEAFTAAADPSKFPEQLQEGITPWKAKRILWNTFNFGGNNTTSEDQLKIDVGGYNALLGKSYGEIAAESRSRHKSQGFGVSRQRGEAFEYFVHIDGEKAVKDLTDGIELGWKRIENGAAVEAAVQKIIADYSFAAPERSLPALVKLYKLLETYPESYWISQKKKEVRLLVEACSGLYAEAYTTRQYVVPGDTLRVTFNFNLRKAAGTFVKISSDDAEGADTVLSRATETNKTIQLIRTVKVPESKALSQPYWLRQMPDNGMFTVDDPSQIGEAENKPPFNITFTAAIEGVDFKFVHPVLYRFVDPVKAEIYQPLYVVPPVEAAFERENYLSINGKPVKATVRLKSNTTDSKEYILRLRHAKSQKSDISEIPFTTGGKEKEKTMTVTLSPRAPEGNTVEQINLSAEGDTYAGSVKTITYDHIPSIAYLRPAKTNLIKSDVKTVGKKIGYIVGAGDKVPQALEEMGFEVKLLSENDLTETGLKQFKAVITGVRAYNVHEDLASKYEALMNYVKNGGNLIVQYNTNSNVGPVKTNIGPYPFVISRTRVTEEDAEVKMLLPDHPVLNYPNKITDQDFQGWVQERSVYQAEQIDARYATPLAMNDAGEKESSGSLLIGPYGKGNFVYASLVFFRQLPAGVPGAYRLMANLIALPSNNQTSEKTKSRTSLP